MNKIMASCKPSALKKAKGQKLHESKIDPSEEALARRNAILDKVDAADGRTSRPSPATKKQVKKKTKVDPRIQQSLDEGAENYNPRGYMGHTKKKTEEKPAPTKKKGPCWKGYEMVGMKKKGGRKVPNCVPLKK